MNLRETGIDFQDDGVVMGNLELFEKAPNETVREYAYRVLYENIMSLKLPPGTAMSEQELSGILNVSRTPVREAFIRLSQKGLLEILPQRGTFVSKIHTEQLAEFRFFRVTLERAIIELACQAFPDPWRTKLEFCIFEQGKFITSKDAENFFKSDNTLHSLLYEGCGKPHIWQIVQESNLDYARARVLNVSDAAEQMNLLYEQHKGIVGAIFAGNTEMAQRIMTEHINKVMGDVEVLKKEYPEYFR